MKKVNLSKQLLLFVVSLFCVNQSFATGVQDDVRKLKSFYVKYITNLLENKDEAKVPLKSECVAPELLERIPALNERSGFDLIINAQNSLKIESLGKPDWYMVTYSWNGKDETAIVVKLERMDNKLMIRYIIPIEQN